MHRPAPSNRRKKDIHFEHGVCFIEYEIKVNTQQPSSNLCFMFAVAINKWVLVKRTLILWKRRVVGSMIVGLSALVMLAQSGRDICSHLIIVIILFATVK